MAVTVHSDIKSNLTSAGTSKRSRFVLTVLCVSASLYLSDLPLFAQDRLLPVFYFQQLKGLTSDAIRSYVVRDPQGFVWVGTESRLNRYDAYSVKEYRRDPNDPHSISSNTVHCMYVDRKKRLWLGTHDSGLSLYDPLRDRFVNFIPRGGDSSWYQAQCIESLLEDRSGNIWMATLYSGIIRAELPREDIDDLDSLSHRIHFTTYPLGTPRNIASSILKREDGSILIGSDNGMIVLDPQTREMSRIHFSDPTGRRLNSPNILSLLRDSQGNLWVGTETDGLFRIDRSGRTVANYRHEKGNEFSLKSDVIWFLANERGGNLWVGSEGGVDLFSPSTGQCIPYLTIGSPPHWPSKYLCMSLDSNAVVWVGTSEKGAYWFSQESQRFPLYGLRDKDGLSPISFTSVDRDEDGAYWFMSSRGVLYRIDPKTQEVVKRIDVLRGERLPFQLVATFIDRRGIYWYGTSGLGLFRVDLKSGHIRNYNVKAGLGPLRTVEGIAQGEGDTLWIAAYHDGLMKFNSSSGLFTKVSGLPAGDVYSVRKDHTGRIWIGSELNGVIIFDPKTGSMEQVRNSSSDPRSLSSGLVHYTYEDSSGRMWVGAGHEINLWDQATHSFTRYTNPGFPRTFVADPVGSDHKGRLWIKYEYEGVAVLDPSNGTFTDFDITDGIDAYLTMANLPDGRIVMPNWAGINIFNPDSINVHRPPPPLVITRMSINDEPAVPLGYLRTSTPLRLRYSQNVLEFEFAAIDIDAPQLVEYQYQLEGLEKEWVKPQNRRFVRYPSLPPGDYVFKVRAASSRSEWPDQAIELGISIAPPWWRTTWAYGGYGVFVIAILFGSYRLRLRQIQLKQVAEMEHFQAEHLAEVDRLKSRFFSNISHEFRTPLTLILGPAEQGMAASGDEAIRQKFHLIRDNARKLHVLVSQLLDFSRLESGVMRLQVSDRDILQFLRRVAMSFESWADRKRIGLEFRSDAELIPGYSDADNLEKIVNNLLSNALKFTPEGGRVDVSVRLIPSTIIHSPGPEGKPTRGGQRKNVGPAGEFVEITVRDTGPGISTEHLPHIFDRFYRVDETHSIEGTGIGLALTKELVELHHGTITVESIPGRGSVFTVTLPIDKGAYKPSEINDTPAEGKAQEPIEVAIPSAESRIVPTAPTPEGKPIVLIVEDNAQLRAYIREYLDADYAVQEAGNGKEGYDQATEVVPDIVISDVMMPEMDGMELCRALKQDVRTSHVPIILLTARAGTDSKIEGLEIGADDYVTKPFDSKELVARLRNLIEQRRQLRKKFSEGVVLKPGDVALSSLDDTLLKKVMASVEKNIADENFGVDDLAREACLSRAHLNRKLQALTDLSPAELIRRMRLERARQLLEKHAGSIADIAYQVGFGNPSHFSASFRDRFGILPSEVYRHKE